MRALKKRRQIRGKSSISGFSQDIERSKESFSIEGLIISQITNLYPCSHSWRAISELFTVSQIGNQFWIQSGNLLEYLVIEKQNTTLNQL